MSFTVIKPGLLSSFQDTGRTGYQHLGLSVGGAMDSRAHRLANLLTGNPENEATLEITLAGPTLAFQAPCCIAICGADLEPSVNGRGVPNNRPLVLRAGDTLAFGRRQQGLRAYVAFHGGVDIPRVMGSRSTNLRSGLGGFQGRALAANDVVGLRKPLSDVALDALEDALWQERIYLPASLTFQARSSIRAMRGAHARLFTDQALQHFFGSPYRISPQSERMGYRLQGPELATRTREQLLSEVTSFGTVQVPPDGQPIVLMADRQTTGGYTKIAHVASVDLPLVAQHMPGDTLQFREISVQEAIELDCRREAAFAGLHEALRPVRERLATHATGG